MLKWVELLGTLVTQKRCGLNAIAFAVYSICELQVITEHKSVVSGSLVRARGERSELQQGSISNGRSEISS